MRPAPFFVVRSPLLEGRSEGAPSAEDLVRAPIVREALERASPSLVEALDGTRQSRVDPWPAITRYLERMRGRCTPFSLMSGYAWGTTGGSTEVRFVSREHYRRIVRVDVDAVGRAVTTRASAAREQATWIAPHGLSRLGDVVRVATRDGEQVRLVDVDRSGALERALEAAERPVPLAAVVDAVVPFAPGGRGEAEAFVSRLIDEHLLVPAGTPPVLVANELEHLERLGGEDERLAAHARAVRSTPLGEPVQLGALRREDLIFDLVKPTERASLGDDVLGALRALLRAFPRMTAQPRRDPRLDDFRRRFQARYEGREVPLVEAADPRRGLGFPLAASPLGPPPAPSDLDAWLLGVFERARRGGPVVELHERDLLPTVRWSLQECFAVDFALARDPTTLWDVSVGGAPGTLLYARGTAVLPDELRARATEFLAGIARRQPDEDLVDIAYYLPGRSAAFTQYPPLMPMELTLTPTSAEDPSRTIDANDLLVSVVGEEVRLRSAKTRRPVRLRKTNAANTNRRDTTDLYRLVCAIAAQGGTWIHWGWGPLRGAPWLPRVSYEGHVVAPEEWNIGPAETERARKAKTRQQRWDEVQRLRRSVGLPRRVLFQEAFDLVLPVDLDDPGSVEAFADLGTEHWRLIEPFPVERSAVTGPEGPYHHNIVVPFEGDPPKPDPRPAASGLAPVIFDRVLPGRSPLYASFWGDADELLAVLRDVVDRVVRPLEAEGAVTHWFFLPFSDPDTHVRLRLFGDAQRLWDGSALRALSEVLEPLVRARAVWRLALDTYDRETYRYGGPRGVELAERVFHASSEIALALHESTLFDVEEAAEIEAMMVPYVGSLRALLAATELPLEAQREVARLAATSYTRGADAAEPRKRAAELYRKLREPLLAWTTDAGEVVRGRLDALRPVLAEARATPMTSGLDRWLADCLHVHSVRLLTTWHPVEDIEAVAYHLLEKLLGTEAAVGKGRPA